jgi:hypothetical protein
MCTEGEHREYKPGREWRRRRPNALMPMAATLNTAILDGEAPALRFDGTETADSRDYY